MMKKYKKRSGRLKGISSILWMLFFLCILKPASGALVYAGEGSLMELNYAEEFSAEYLENGCCLVTVEGEKPFLLVPEDEDIPEDAGEECTIVRTPLKSVYVASSSAMDLFLHAGAIDAVSMTSTSAENWSVPEIADLVREDEITYVGKYDAPDYETIMDIGSDLAVENMMISHSPETKDLLEKLGIPVLVERSSYESHPLGRLEWIRLYGLLTGKTEEADRFFFDSMETVRQMEEEQGESVSVAFFSITSGGTVSIRTPDDYIAKMVEIAGGTYLFPEDGRAGGTGSSMNIQMESFYALAKDADILIYNGTIQGEITRMDELLEKSPLFTDFKAVQEGRVWCTQQNVFQHVSGTAEMISDFHRVISGSGEPLTYLHRVE